MLVTKRVFFFIGEFQPIVIITFYVYNNAKQKKQLIILVMKYSAEQYKLTINQCLQRIL